MSLLVRAGITRLSELEIDADKDWQDKGISNIKEVALGMSIGDIVQHNGARLVKLVPGEARLVLTSQGPGKMVVWAPGGTYFHRYFPVTVGLAHSEAKASPDKLYDKSIPASTWNRQAYEDAPADYIKRLTPVISLADAQAVVTPDKTGEKTPAVNTGFKLKIPVGGAVAEDGGVLTNETTAAQNSTANDMHLLPEMPAVDDAYYFGHARKFDVMWLDIGTQGDGIWEIAWEYWNGTTWTALPDVVDNTNGLTAIAGLHDVSFTRPGDWATRDVGEVAGLYWIRARVSSYTSITTQPLGNQAWVEIYF